MRRDDRHVAVRDLRLYGPNEELNNTSVEECGSVARAPGCGRNETQEKQEPVTLSKAIYIYRGFRAECGR